MERAQGEAELAKNEFQAEMARARAELEADLKRARAQRAAMSPEQMMRELEDLKQAREELRGPAEQGRRVALVDGVRSGPLRSKWRE